MANNNNLVIIPTNVTEANIVSMGTKYTVRKIAPANYNDDLLFIEDGAIPALDSMRLAFLKCLYTGNLNLYLYIDKLKRNHFFVEDKDNFMEIYFHNHKESRYLQGVSSKNKQYEFVLKTLMTPCRSLFSIIENIGLNEEQLIQLFTMYDKCMAIKKEEEKQ